MNLEDLKAFIRLEETLHFGTASKACNLSPSTLSRIIKRLEATLGQQLFERDNRSVQLTPAGEKFRVYARDALDRWETFQDDITLQHDTLKGDLRMCCTITASYGVLPDMLVQFRDAHPAVHITLLTGDSERAIQNVMSGTADLAVAALPDKIPDTLCFKAITTIRLQFVEPAIPWPFQKMLRQSTVPWAVLPLIVAETGMARRRTEAWFRARGIRPNIYAQVSGNESILAMVSLGFGVGIVPHLALEKNLLERDVRVLAVRPEIKPYSVGICALKRRLKNPLVGAFWAIIPPL